MAASTERPSATPAVCNPCVALYACQEPAANTSASAAPVATCAGISGRHARRRRAACPGPRRRPRQEGQQEQAHHWPAVRRPRCSGRGRRPPVVLDQGGCGWAREAPRGRPAPGAANAAGQAASDRAGNPRRRLRYAAVGQCGVQARHGDGVRRRAAGGRQQAERGGHGCRGEKSGDVEQARRQQFGLQSAAAKLHADRAAAAAIGIHARAAPGRLYASSSRRPRARHHHQHIELERERVVRAQRQRDNGNGDPRLSAAHQRCQGSAPGYCRQRSPAPPARSSWRAASRRRAAEDARQRPPVAG